MASRDAGKGAGASVKGLLDSLLNQRRLLRRRRLLARLLGRHARPSALEDIVQEAFVAHYAASRRPYIRTARRSVLRLIHGIALHQPGRRLNRSLSAVLTEADPVGLLREGDYADRLRESREDFLACCRAVASLPLLCRRAFILRKVYGLSLPEISAQLGIGLDAARTLVADGLADLLEQGESSRRQDQRLRPAPGRVEELHCRD